MPYIKQDQRKEFDDALTHIGNNVEDTGELNYCITVLLKHYLFLHGKSYKTINDCIGVLEASKIEFYRRVVAEYEDIKIKENGDIKL